jgi:voltage-gated potassium channel
VTPHRLSELSKAQRRRALLRTSCLIVIAWFVLIGSFFVAPIGGTPSGLSEIARLGAGIALIAGVLAWQTRHIVRAELPELRAVEALAVFFPLFLVLFSTAYLSLSHQSPADFSQHLDHVRALYFTITVFSTVGFGDITPRTDPARLLVSLQMLLDLAIIGVVVRLIFGAAKVGLARQDDE